MPVPRILDCDSCPGLLQISGATYAKNALTEWTTSWAGALWYVRPGSGLETLLETLTYLQHHLSDDIASSSLGVVLVGQPVRGFPVRRAPFRRNVEVPLEFFGNRDDWCPSRKAKAR